MSLVEEYNLTDEQVMNRLGLVGTSVNNQIYELRVIYRNKNNAGWHMHAAQIVPVDKKEDPMKEVYKENAFFIAYHHIESIQKLFELLSTTGVSVVENYPTIKIQSDKRWHEVLIPSHSSSFEIPSRHLYIDINSDNWGDEELIGYKLPFYKSFSKRVREFIYLDKHENKRLHILIPDNRASLKISDTSIAIERSEGISLVGEIISGTDIKKISDENHSSIDLSTVEKIDLFLIDKNNIIYDYVSSHDFLYPFKLNVKDETIEEHILDLIGKGESIDCEFKPFMDLGKGESKPDEIDETVCAFSNANGGELIIGVTDNGEIIGVDEKIRVSYRASLEESVGLYIKALKKRLYENLSKSDCFEIGELNLCGKKLIIISVTGKHNWNCIQTSGVPYLRRGATNINATRLATQRVHTEYPRRSLGYLHGR